MNFARFIIAKNISDTDNGGRSVLSETGEIVSHVGYEWSEETTGEYRMEKERKVIDLKKEYEGAAECAVATVLPAVSYQESKVTIKFKVIDINYDEGMRWIEKRHMRLDLTIGLKPSGSGKYRSLAGRGTITDTSLNIGDTFQVWVEVTKERAKFGIIFEDRTELRDDFKINMTRSCVWHLQANWKF